MYKYVAAGCSMYCKNNKWTSYIYYITSYMCTSVLKACKLVRGIRNTSKMVGGTVVRFSFGTG